MTRRHALNHNSLRHRVPRLIRNLAARRLRLVDPRQDSPTRDFARFFTHLKSLDFAPATCIDVGAANGTPSIYSAFPDARHLAFEPLQEFQDSLHSTLAPYNHRIFSVSLMDQPGEQSIVRSDDAYGSSMMHSLADGHEKLLTVRVDTLDHALADEPLDGPCLLKTDCQGADLAVIKGGAQTLAKCDVVILEVSLFRYWGPHHPDFHDIISYMHDRGFVVYDLLDGLFRPLDGALGQIDVVFVKEHGGLRASSHW